LEPAYLLTPLAGEDQQADHVAIAIIAKGSPDQSELGISQDPASRSAFIGAGCASDRIGLK
jgi:hypothetical protein